MAHLYPGYLGILKWSLSQSDGTRPSEFQPMAEEVRAKRSSVLERRRDGVAATACEAPRQRSRLWTV